MSTAALIDPLPDPPITIRPAPRREPPFDDELPVRPLHLVGSCDQMLPFPTGDVWRSDGTNAGVTLANRGSLPDPVVFGRRLVIGLLETLAGRRPLRQLTPHFSPGVTSGLTRRLTTAAPAPRRPATLRSMHGCEPADGVAELAAVIEDGGRVRAIALRLEGQGGRWTCVRLQMA